MKMKLPTASPPRNSYYCHKFLSSHFADDILKRIRYNKIYTNLYILIFMSTLQTIKITYAHFGATEKFRK